MNDKNGSKNKKKKFKAQRMIKNNLAFLPKDWQNKMSRKINYLIFTKCL